MFIAFWQFRHPCAGLAHAAGVLRRRAGGQSLDAAIVAAGAMGAVAGFLWWNAAPARIFMGDTGSLGLGGLLGALALLDEHAAAALDPRRAVRDRDDCR